MLQVKNLTITHRKDLRVILEKFNMVLNPGDKAVIIGEEGNGKSTLLKWIYDPDSVDFYTECEGERILGKERLAYLPQELPEEDRRKTVYEFFGEARFFFEKNPAELAELAGTFRVNRDFWYSEQRMESLSGGEKIKAQLMRILLDEPTALLLDEPSNDIDMSTLDLLEHIINEWNGIVLFVSHDEVLIEHTANMVVHIEQVMRKTKCRYTVAHMSYPEYLENRQNIFDNQERQAMNDRREKRLRDERFMKIMQSVSSALGNVSRQAPGIGKNLKDKMHSVKAMEKRFEREDEKMTPMPEQEEAIFFKLGDADSEIPAGKNVIEFHLDKLYTPDHTRVLAEPVHLFVRGSKKICIIGDNGAGKTTLIKKIAEELLARTDIHAEYMPQNYEELLDMDKTPVEYLDTSGKKEEQTRIRTYLGALKYTADEMEHPIRELSGGQKAKVFLLKLSLSHANVLILDEPTRNFSPLSGPVIRRLISEFPGAVISISHDRKFIFETAEEVYRLTPNGLLKLGE